MEIWKTVIGFEDYEISNLGNIKSLKFNKIRNLNPGINSKKYYNITLFKNGIRKTKEVHQIVAESFLNHIPNGKILVVNHKDFNRLNNCVENLEIITTRENTNREHLKYSSKYVGVNWNKRAKKWRSSIRIDNKKIQGVRNFKLKTTPKTTHN